jgi:uroporphyrinogen-III synthase
MANVLLLRTPSQETPDPYEDCFRDFGYRPSSLPILETAFTNFDDLKRTIVNGPKAQNFAGVIITSARACEAWGQVVEHFIPELDQAGQSVRIRLELWLNYCSQLVLYAFLCRWRGYC